MFSKLLKILSLSYFVFIFGCGLFFNDNKTEYKDTTSEIKMTHFNIQHAIDKLPESGGTISLKAGTYIINKPIHINRSNIKLIGEKGTLIKLADNANCPVILIGSDEEIPKKEIKNITISDIEIDGNKLMQKSETELNKPWLRNNGIDIRKVNFLWIKDVYVYNNRSGGLVASWGCKNIFINSSVFENNYFDGIALYDSEDIIITNFSVSHNKSAGISLDNRLKHIVFSNGLVKNNGDVGIFIRESTGLQFYNILVYSNDSHGCFLSHNLEHKWSGVSDTFFNGCSFINNNGWGFWLASDKENSKNNAIASSIFSGNKAGAINVDKNGELLQQGNILNKGFVPDIDKL